jgi:hypothetical protein
VVEVGIIVASGAIVALIGRLADRWVLLVLMPGGLLLVVILLAWLIGQRQLARQAIGPITWYMRILGPITWYMRILGYIGFWLLYGTSTWLIALSVASELDPAWTLDIIASAALAWVTGFIVIFVPSGLGVREGVMALTLVPILGTGRGIFVPLAARLVAVISEIAFLALGYVVYRLWNAEMKT